MKKTICLIAAVLLLGCVQQAAQAPSPTPISSVISAATTTPTAAKSNFSNELAALSLAIENIKVAQGELMDSFAAINDEKQKLAEYSLHLEELDPVESETVFLKQGVEAANRLLKSNEYYLGAVNNGKRTETNFTCSELKAYNLALDYEEKCISEGRQAISLLYSLDEKYPSLAGQTSIKSAGNLTAAFYDGMEDSLQETRAFLKEKCG